MVISPDAVELNFSRAEYADRLLKTRIAMQAAELECLIITDPANMAWLTGYDGWSFYVHQCVIITLAGEPMWYGRGIDMNGAKRTTYLSDDNIIEYPDYYVQAEGRHPMDYLAQILGSKGFGSFSIGVEMDNYYFTAAAFASLVRNLPNADFKDCKNLVHWQRSVKSEQELSYMRKAGKIVEVMHQRIRETIRPGLRKHELVAAIYDASLCGVPEYGGDYPAIVPLLPSGLDASASHLTWNDKPMKSGEGTFFEIAGVYRRYHCPLSRTVFLGKPGQDILDSEKAVLEGLAAGLEKAKAGNLCEDIAIAFFAVLEKHGIIKDSRTGYSTGLAYPPDWGEHTMSLRKGDKTILQKGMTFHFMPGLWSDDWGLEITETIAIGENGPEFLSSVPRELAVIS